MTGEQITQLIRQGWAIATWNEGREFYLSPPVGNPLESKTTTWTPVTVVVPDFAKDELIDPNPWKENRPEMVTEGWWKQ